MRSGVVLFCLVSCAVSVPLRNQGKAPFEADYEVKDFDAQSVINDDIVASKQNIGLEGLPPAPSKLSKEQQFRSHHEIALLMAREPVPGAPPAVAPEIDVLEDNTVPMAPAQDEPLDADCDSPQLGDTEPYPQAGVVVNMNNTPSNASVPEQDESSREVLMDSQNYLPIPKESATLPHPNQPDVPTNHGPDELGRFGLPPPDAEELRRNKCSRNTNGNDVPPGLDDLGEDCGMPEPVIPCETAGNSTKCEPNIVLRVPPIPPADKMPPIPVAPPHHDYLTELSFEFPDFGLSITRSSPVIQTVFDAIVHVGEEFELADWHIQMIRNAGAQIDGERKIFTLVDQRQLVVYLKCAKKMFQDKLIVRLPVCEDMNLQMFEVRVEVPETDDVFVVVSPSTASVHEVIASTPVPPKAISKITYNGARVLFNQTLHSLHFANRSAIVVYLTTVAAVNTITGNELPTIVPGGNSQDNDTTPNGTDMSSVIPIPPLTNHEDRLPMVESAVVIMHISDQTFLDFPVLIQPDQHGLVLFDALKQRTGRPYVVMNLLFMGKPIEQATPLKPLGFLNGDIINVVLLPPPQLGFDPNGL